MISDTQLSFIANSFGVFAMILIVVYHYIAQVNGWLANTGHGILVYLQTYTMNDSPLVGKGSGQKKSIYCLKPTRQHEPTAVFMKCLPHSHTCPLDLRQLTRDPSHNCRRGSIDIGFATFCLTRLLPTKSLDLENRKWPRSVREAYGWRGKVLQKNGINNRLCP
ncbi:unnamed protein product [Absidia cylindrospora]